MTPPTLRTPRHKHRTVKVPDNKFGLAVIRVLRKPRYWTSDRTKVDASPYPYGVRMIFGMETYYLSALSVLHRWFGLTLDMRSWTEED